MNLEEKELNKKSGIYMWTSPSGKKYIGQTKNLGSRHKDFRCASENRPYVGSKSIIDKARQKYCFDQWQYKILEYCDIKDLDAKEKYYINTYNPEYNITRGGIGGCGVPKTAFKKGNIVSENKIIKARETLRKHIKEGSVNYEDRSSKVVLYTKEGYLYKVYSSQKEACTDIGLKSKSLSSYLKNNSLILNKYLVRYVESNVLLFIEPYVRKQRTFSKETRLKMSLKKINSKVPSRWKSVIATNEKTKEILNFNSIKEAANFVWPQNPKSAAKNISQAVLGKRRVAYNYIWNIK